MPGMLVITAKSRWSRNRASIALSTAQGGRGLVAGQQRERTSVGEVQGPLQTGEDAAQLGADTVDGASAVGDQVRATPCEDLEVRDGFVADM
ncbi:hypothetical protein [Streptomyces sp. V2I9]|uniref:hypothetical protein n=1 Tax=Streptomyces sp. V2I9 TaxID=3042304 RepID=UPI0027829379|nr:hypothetical protein [Streptomyces sp. V2I9]